MSKKSKERLCFFVELDEYQFECLRSLSVAFPDWSRNSVVGKAIEMMALHLPSDFEFVDGAWKMR